VAGSSTKTLDLLEDRLDTLLKRLHESEEVRGKLEKRGPTWEGTCAGVYLQAGADILIMAHPEAIKSAQQAISQMLLMQRLSSLSRMLLRELKQTIEGQLWLRTCKSSHIFYELFF